MAIPKTKRMRDPDEDRDLDDLVREVVPEPEKWLKSPHDLLGGKSPCELIGTANELRVRDLVRALKHGIPT